MPDRVEFFQFLQWLADEQLAEAQAEARAAGMPVGLYLDLAVGVDPDGAEAWADPETVAGRVRVGAPPDDFSPKGQDWGLAPLAPLALRAQAYAPFIELLRRNMAHAGALRIDHVLGLRRSFWLPPERDLPGAYVRYPLSDLLGLIALEAGARALPRDRRGPRHGSRGLSRDALRGRAARLPRALFRA